MKLYAQNSIKDLPYQKFMDIIDCLQQLLKNFNDAKKSYQNTNRLTDMFLPGEMERLVELKVAFNDLFNLFITSWENERQIV